MSIRENLQSLNQILPGEVTLVAVSKTKPTEDILEAYECGHRDFGENRVQEMEEKAKDLPSDIRWHLIGHLQRNKVKYIAPYVSLIHSVDSESLLKEINKQAKRNERIIDCLLQIKIAEEDSKFGMEEAEAEKLLSEYADKFPHVRITGLMGMGTFTDDAAQTRREFQRLKKAFDKMKKDRPEFTVLSMGMSDDYPIALEEGSNMVRVGSLIFGSRN